MLRDRFGEHTVRTHGLSGRGWFARPVLRCGILTITGLFLLLHAGCFWRRRSPQALPPVSAQVSLVFLPFNVLSENTDLRWMALAFPALLARAAKNGPDLDIVPLWQSMPVAVEVAGDSRSLNPELASFIASRLAARWATTGDVSSTEEDLTLLIDFIPTKSSQIPFRYQKRTGPDSLGELCRSAIDQFQRYLVVRPLSGYDSSKLDMDFWRTIAEAVDREYGWFRAAEPGKASEAVLLLSRMDVNLARMLFNPALYPGLGPPPGSPRSGIRPRFQELPIRVMAAAEWSRKGVLISSDASHNFRIPPQSHPYSGRLR